MRHKPKNDYPSNWDLIALQIKTDADWRCVRCNESHIIGNVLTVHHLDGDKANCEWWNLAPLCQRCHLHIQGKVNMHQIYMFDHSEWMKPYVAGYVAHVKGLPTNREYINKHLNELLRI